MDEKNTNTSAADITPIARFLGMSAAILMILGLLTGGYVSNAMVGKIPVDPHAALASHLNALLGCFWIVAVAWSLPLLRYGPVGLKRLAWLVIVPNYANWIVTAVKAWLHVAGVDPSGSPANVGVFVALTVGVVSPSLAAAGARAYGFRSH